MERIRAFDMARTEVNTEVNAHQTNFGKLNKNSISKWWMKTFPFISENCLKHPEEQNDLTYLKN